MSLHLTRDCRALLDNLQEAAELDALTPQKFRSGRLLLVARFDQVEAIINSVDTLSSVELSLLDCLDDAKVLLAKFSVLHESYTLPPLVFEAGLGWLRAVLAEIDRWTEGVALRGAPPLNRWPLAGRVDAVTDLPVIGARWVDRGPRHFAVIEGGRAS